MSRERKINYEICIFQNSFKYPPNLLTSVHPVRLRRIGSGQGLSVFATAGIVGLFRGLQKSENDAPGRSAGGGPDGH